ncbi:MULTISPECIES: hypothetical protein [Solibacillus]|uniref:Uncharacterized protein n=1 Tax=Solibacillus merdavium TaxID=2762218 RepID=A0ABR8XR47_9BACL|nr:hypothetical protein [Solibacillus merdavium]MBD8034422.1 hypothetical protein [Solibacillus merdavium]
MNYQQFENEIEQFAFEELKCFYTGETPVLFEYFDTPKSGVEFEIIQTEESYVIRGNTSRSLLYGVYKLIEKIEGIVFFDLYLPKKIVAQGITGTYEGNPKFARRGNVFETIDDIPFLKSMLDVGTKNGLNEAFFTFFLWDEVKEVLLPEIRKRGIDVTLGGHSLRYLVAKANGATVSGKSAADGAVNDLIGEETEFTAANAIKNHDFLQDEKAQQAVIQIIVSYCKAEPVIRRISLWPEDVGAKGEDAKLFLTQYIAFTEKLQEALVMANLQVEVEHIVYNAGLSWEMLERKGHQVSSANVLYAYWGRDYSQNFTSQIDQRAWDSLLDWRSATDKQVTVFEYYSDHFMLSELFPLLFNRLAMDTERYKEIGCNGMVNLVVPLHKVAKAQPHMEHYDYQQYQQLNNIVFARSLWEGVETVFYLMSPSMQQLSGKIEGLFAQISQYNATFFPNRVVEAKNSKCKSEVLELLNAMEQLLQQEQIEEPLQQYVEALQQVVNATKLRWEAL